MTSKYTELLGPVFLHWIAQLHDKLAFLADTKGRKALYCTRAGKRIEDLMQAYASTGIPFDSELFGISRISACKVGAPFPETFSTAHRITSESLRHVTLADLCGAYLQHEWDDANPAMAALSGLRQPYNESNFRSLIAANDPASVFFRDRLIANHAGLDRWLSDHLHTAQDKRDNTGYVLVDSGWKGSIQRMLGEVFPRYGFEGVYFGVQDAAFMPGRYGIVFDAPHYRSDRPETVFTIHRHLIETILEPNAPSVEELVYGPNDALARAQLQAVRAEIPDPNSDALFLGIRDYIATHSDLSSDRVFTEYRHALAELVPSLITPSREDALALAGKNRSVDFGRQGNVPVLMQDRAQDTAQLRIQCSLWPQGQIALEHESKKARQLQLQVSGLEDSRSFFASHEKPRQSPRAEAYVVGKPAEWAGSVAVVTRTKNRPLLLRRAMQSIARQTWKNIQWVVVNDGGETDSVREIVQASGIDPTRITLIENFASVGMEAASNMGVRAVDTEFVVIHDDDDRWEPNFLCESIEFLQTPRAAAADFEGVLSRAWRVSEQIDGDQVTIHRSEPYMPWVSEVSLAQMAVGNFFAPISFLYRRWVFDEVGGYDERLPVLGDWRFNLDFLMCGNIGFLDRYLSHYHHRDMGDSSSDGVYANSVVGARSLHSQYFSVVTNRILRDPSTPESLRQVISNAHQQRVMEHNVQTLRSAVEQLQGRLDHHMGVSWNNQQAVLKQIYPDRETAKEAAKLTEAPTLLDEDMRHIRNVLRKKLPYTASPRRIAARLRWELRLSMMNSPSRSQTWLPKLFHLIPSPDHFDNIGYLRDHPQIWATQFNGKGEWLPYHHYLLGRYQTAIHPTHAAKEH
ncbi:glycosyltransferase family A protein [Loktanella sp. SALINAS62]|uniref:glycosyltransferase family A protein n=1 Tax=Loktanella sp. SALINAS62 TaxID=2706124 RepID=UPI001B8B1D14|nr:glycosyltransferase family A protein [Loktanella sp. SALINAS62]MBS1301790.1 glycosyltransferase family 2 protein [Loktanella sp. SALINAS62]